MALYTGTNGNDTLTGTNVNDTFNPLLGQDTVDGAGGIDTLNIDYSSVANGWSSSIGTNNAGSFSGNILIGPH